jgi:hypothetical protein
MSSRPTSVGRQLSRDKSNPVSGSCGDLGVSGAHPFLLQPDPEAQLHVELVDHPTELSQDQFTALLVDSECEV